MYNGDPLHLHELQRGNGRCYVPSTIPARSGLNSGSQRARGRRPSPKDPIPRRGGRGKGRGKGRSKKKSAGNQKKRKPSPTRDHLEGSHTVDEAIAEETEEDCPMDEDCGQPGDQSATVLNATSLEDSDVLTTVAGVTQVADDGDFCHMPTS